MCRQIESEKVEKAALRRTPAYFTLCFRAARVLGFPVTLLSFKLLHSLDGCLCIILSDSGSVVIKIVLL